MPGAAVFQRRQNVRVPDAVPIHFALRCKTRVERFGDELTAHDPNGGRQNAIQRGNPPVGSITPSRQIDVSALRDGVDSGIGSSRAMNANAFRTNMFECRLEVVLDAVAVGLTLPSGKWPAVIGDDELEPRGHLIALCRTGVLSGAARRLQRIEVTLQNHLRSDLVNHAARMARLLPAIAQRPICRHCRHTFVPGYDFALDISAQFFREGEGLRGANTYAPIHVTR